MMARPDGGRYDRDRRPNPQMRVLLVEDEPHAAKVLAKGLREQAYAVDLAADGDTAIFRRARRTTMPSFSTS